MALSTPPLSLTDPQNAINQQLLKQQTNGAAMPAVSPTIDYGQNNTPNTIGITDPGQGPNKTDPSNPFASAGPVPPMAGGGVTGFAPTPSPWPTSGDPNFPQQAAKAAASTNTQTPTTVPNGDYQSWFMNLVGNQPWNQQTFNALAPQLQTAGIQITPPNANGDQTKIGIPDGHGGTQWVRVGFGEGHPVWIPQNGSGDSNPNAVGGAQLPSIFGGAQSGQANDLFNLLMGRAQQSLNINPNDPIIRNQIDNYAAQQERGRRNYLQQVAEQAGPGANTSAEARASAEQVGQGTSAFSAQIGQNELNARRQEIQNALSGASGLLTTQQQLALQEELAQLQLQQNAYQFDTNQQYLNSPLNG